jgi:hypothetical protein
VPGASVHLDTAEDEIKTSDEGENAEDIEAQSRSSLISDKVILPSLHFVCLCILKKLFMVRCLVGYSDAKRVMERTGSEVAAGFKFLKFILVSY